MANASFLSAIDLFQGVPDHCLQALHKNSHTFDCNAGHLFFSLGEAGRGLFLLEKGCIRTFRNHGTRKLTGTTLQAPAVFGEMGCFGQGIHPCAAEAVEPSRVRIVSRESMQAILECDPNIAHRVVELVSRGLLRFLQELESLALKGLIARLAILLLENAQGDVVRGMTHKELAGELGVYRESITAALGELRTAGIVAIDRKEIRILQPTRLERAARE
jgi:CRP/FNR family cyclic AMP-dependent transcriptional regulator